MKRLSQALTLIAFTFLSLNSFSQGNDSLKLDKKEAINLFVDCNYCDIEYFKETITLVNYVRDPNGADVHLLITEMETGSGGTEYTLAFYGIDKYNKLTDTLSFALPPSSTDEEEREAQVLNIKKGLTPFILKTPFSKYISISYKMEEGSRQDLVEDKWKSWVISTDVSGFANGESMYSSLNLWSSVEVSKITPDIKYELSYNNNFSESIFIIADVKEVFYSRSNSLNALVVKSVGEHWAIGGFSNIYGSTYSNIEYAISLTPAAEYNLFKYKDATTKQLRFLYRIGYKYNDYIDTTIYNKTTELLPYHHLSINFKSVKKWGSVEGSVYASNYLNDFSKNRVGIQLGSDIRLFKGLSFRLYGGYSQKRDQISIAKETSSKADVLLRKKEMASDYSFWVNFGLSYTFGSIYNNVVNPRFDN